MRPALALTLVLTGVITAISGHARADADEPIAVQVQDSLRCTTSADFFDRVRRRTQVARLAQRGESARLFTVGAEPGGADVRGHLVVRHLDGSQSSRTVEGASCDEVVDALALVVALDLDPAAVRAGAALDARPETRPWSAPPVVDSADVPLAPPRTAETETRGDRPWAWRFDAGAQLAITQGIAPVPLVSVPIYVEMRRRSFEVFAPSFALGFERTLNARVVGEQGDAVLHVIEGFAVACPLAWSVVSVRVSPCARLEVGALEGIAEIGKRVAVARRERRTWAALSVAARASVRVYGGLQVDAQFGVGAPIVPRYELRLDPDESLGRVDRWQWRGAIGVSVRFL